MIQTLNENEKNWFPIPESFQLINCRKEITPQQVAIILEKQVAGKIKFLSEGVCFQTESATGLSLQFFINLWQYPEDNSRFQNPYEKSSCYYSCRFIKT